METVRARVVKNDCEECVIALALEWQSFSERPPIIGAIVNIPEHCLASESTHGLGGVKFHLEMADPDAPQEPQRAKSGEVEFAATDTKMDATKHIGYPVRENGTRYGSHSMHDDFNDQSDPDGS